MPDVAIVAALSHRVGPGRRRMQPIWRIQATQMVSRYRAPRWCRAQSCRGCHRGGLSVAVAAVGTGRL